MNPQVTSRPSNVEIIEGKCRTYLSWFRFNGMFWRTVHYALGIIAIVVAGIAAAKEFNQAGDTIRIVGRWAALVSPMLVALIAFLNAQNYSASWFEAWR